MSQVYRHYYLTKGGKAGGVVAGFILAENQSLALPLPRGGFRFKLFKRQDMKRQNQKIVLSETRTWGNCESHFYKNEIWWSKIRILGHKRRG